MLTTKNPCNALALGLLAVITVTTAAPAAFVVVNTDTMDNLVAGNSISVGGTNFDQWTVYSNLAFGVGATPVNLSNVMVDAGLEDGVPALRFMVGMSAGAMQLVDLDFGFRVTAPSPIEEVGAELIGSMATGTGVVSLGETIFESFPSTPVGNLSISSLAGSMTDSGPVNPALSEMFVRKDLFLSGGANGTASLDKVLQYYQQVPEPSGLAICAFGLIGLANGRRRFARS